jgi:hypothetical protein
LTILVPGGYKGAKKNSCEFTQVLNVQTKILGNYKKNEEKKLTEICSPKLPEL